MHLSRRLPQSVPATASLPGSCSGALQGTTDHADCTKGLSKPFALQALPIPAQEPAPSPDSSGLEDTYTVLGAQRFLLPSASVRCSSILMATCSCHQRLNKFNSFNSSFVTNCCCRSPLLWLLLTAFFCLLHFRPFEAEIPFKRSCQMNSCAFIPLPLCWTFTFQSDSSVTSSPFSFSIKKIHTYASKYLSLAM